MGFLDNKRRRHNYRPKISGMEKLIGWAILVLLAGIATGVYVKGQHYDSRLFALDDALLETAPTIAETVESRDTTEEAMAEPTTPGILPPKISDWSPMGPVEQFNPKNLYVKINGRAEQYFAYDFVSLKCVTLVHDENAEWFIDIFIYDMGNATNAFGIYSVERSPGPSVPFGDEGYGSGPSVFFRKGPYYNQILAVDEVTEVEQAAQQIAAWLDQAQQAGSSELSVFELFPPDDRVPDSSQYMKTDALGLGFMDDVYTLAYAVNDVEVTAFLTQRTSEQEAQAVFDQYLAYLQQFGTLLPTSEGTTLTTGDLGGFYDVVFRKGTVVGGVNFVEDQAAAEQVAQSLMAGLP